MDSVQLRRIIRSCSEMRELSLGVCPIDKIPKGKPHGFIICNLDKAKDPGSHWVCIFNGSHGIIEIFDSYSGIPQQLNAYTKGHDVVFSPKQVQGHFSTTCGQHCIYFAFHRCRGLAFDQIIDSYSEDTEANDQMVCDFVLETFDLDTDTIDEDMIFMQISRGLNLAPGTRC